MKKRTLFAFLVSLFALALEITPWGAVCIFANPEGDSFRKTYSYFSLVPYGYANFFPLLTAILTVILSLSLIVTLVRGSEKAENSSFLLALVGAVLSLLPLLQGIRYYSLTAGGITLCLGVCALLLWKKGRLS